MTRFAENTTVSSDKSRAEIEKVLSRYGASGFMYGWDQDQNPPRAGVSFRMAKRHIKFLLPLPVRDSKEFERTPGRGYIRGPEAREQVYEQAVRQRWRALALVIKAKLEAVETGITEFEDEFMAHIVMPDGQTVGQHMRPQIAAAYETGKMPKLLPQF